MIVGHHKARKSLERRLWPVTLIVGPSGVGKRTLAEHVARHHGVIQGNLPVIDHLDTQTARDIVRLTQAHAHGPSAVVIIRLGGASESALNALLKVLEEPPSSFRFILLAESLPVPTILSRAVLVRVGLLSCAEVARALQDGGMDPVSASKAAARARGSVRMALDAGAQSEAKGLVRSALRAVAMNEPEALERALRKWTDDSHDMLIVWAVEAASGRWHEFTPAESSGLADDSRLARRILIGAASTSHCRPRLAAHVVLESACAGR